MESLSLRQARRLVIGAQGLSRPRPTGAVDRRHLRRVLGDVGLLQIDSVNVLARAHYLPPFSRLGPYPRDLLERMAYRDREVFEYWGHEASLLPVDLHSLLRWRMRRARERFETWGGIARLAKEHPDYIEQVLREVRERGPVRAGELESEERRRGAWWTWSKPKTALEFLFWTGDVTTAHRRGFERVYDVTDRVLPAKVLAAPTPAEDEAQRALILRAASALGVATASELADYFRIRVPEGRGRVQELVEAGQLQQVRVEGWSRPAYVLPGTTIPRRAAGRALLAPFDPMVWERSRVERLFGFTYRIEIYVPQGKRQHGYYVLPFLLGDRIAARVDLKADRGAGLLRVQAAWLEPGEDPEAVSAALATELTAMSQWLGLGGAVAVANRGGLAPELAAAVG